MRRGRTGSIRGWSTRSAVAASRRSTPTRRRPSNRCAPAATCVVTPTASGKTLCYNLPVIDAVARDDAARALYLFPTKALAADQLVELRALAEAADINLKTHTYDGDTPTAIRSVAERRPGGHHQPGHAPLGDPSAPHQVVQAVREPAVRRDRRAAHLPRPVRQPRRQRHPPPATRLPPLRRGPRLHLRQRHHRQSRASWPSGCWRRRSTSSTRAARRAGASTSWSSTRRSPTRSSAFAGRRC